MRTEAKLVSRDADAIYQNINLIELKRTRTWWRSSAPTTFNRMNIREMIEYHERNRADVTVSAIPVAKEYSREFGVIEAAADGQIMGFHEKNPNAPTMTSDDSRVYASMGNYIFSTRSAAARTLWRTRRTSSSTHDFGRDILHFDGGPVRTSTPTIFQTNTIPGDPPGAEVYLARRRYDRLLLRSQHGSALGHAGAEFVQSPMAAAPLPATTILPPSSPSTTKIAAGKPSIPSWRPARFSPAARRAIR
jgi:hypothetical protein